MQLLCGGPHTGILGGSWPPRAIQLSISGLCYFSPFAVIQAGRTHLSRELLTLCSNQKWPLSLRFFQMDITSPRSPKKSISPLLIVFLFSVGFNCLTAISGLRKERKDCIFNRNWLYLCLFFFYKPHMADRAFVYVADYCKQSPAFLPLCGNGCLKLCKGTSPVNPWSSSRHGLTWHYLFRC